MHDEAKSAALSAQSAAISESIIIGLTGGYCSGKNQIASILEKKGFVAVDVDKLGHKALEISSPKVLEAFGKEVLDNTAQNKTTINRKALGKIVFSDPEKLLLLEAIVHPAMFSLVDDWLTENAHKNCLINAFVLYKMPQALRCKLIIEAHAPLYLRILRGKKRDGLKTIDIIKRILAQNEHLARRKNFLEKLIILTNKGSLATLEKKIDAALKDFQ